MNAERQVGISEVHPWIRFWARSFDLLLVAIPVAVAWWFWFPPAEITWFEVMLFGMAVLFFDLLIEPVLISRLATTPGKWVFSIRVINPDGSLLSFEQALRRSDMVWAKGLGAGTPLVGQFLMAAQHYELSANAKTFWDEEGGFEVEHREIRGARVIGAIAIAVMVLLAAGLTLAAV
ncbi:RDD family protein [Thioalkalivibrio sp.]|uniref:RDD family protein n=1 Tax=Thioalkalivibrio sp. TaxID=2093813 RepID=UPI00397574D8